MIMENAKKPRYISHWIVGINAIVMVAMYYFDKSLSFNLSADLSVQTLVAFGAKINYKILDGEYFRLFTVMFLHADIMHFMFNAVALLAFGPETERIFGKGRFLAIYVLSGLFASVGSFLLTNNISVGASGAIFGLIGANIFLFTYDREKYKAVYGNQMLVLLAINIVYGFFNTKIDDVAHLVGFLGGFVVAWAVGFKYMSERSFKNNLAAVLVIPLVVGGFFAGLWRYGNDADYYYSKGAFLLNEGKVEESLQVFTAGAEKYPKVTQFNELIQQIEQMKKSLH